MRVVLRLLLLVLRDERELPSEEKVIPVAVCGVCAVADDFYFIKKRAFFRALFFVKNMSLDSPAAVNNIYALVRK